MVYTLRIRDDIYMSMEELANHVIAVSQENNLSVSNLELQKILYFTLRNSRNVLDEEEIKDTYDEPFLAWPYGPVAQRRSHQLEYLYIDTFKTYF